MLDINYYCFFCKDLQKRNAIKKIARKNQGTILPITERKGKIPLTIERNRLKGEKGRQVTPDELFEISRNLQENTGVGVEVDLQKDTARTVEVDIMVIGMAGRMRKVGEGDLDHKTRELGGENCRKERNLLHQREPRSFQEVQKKIGKIVQNLLKAKIESIPLKENTFQESTDIHRIILLEINHLKFTKIHKNRLHQNRRGTPLNHQKNSRNIQKTETEEVLSVERDHQNLEIFRHPATKVEGLDLQKKEIKLLKRSHPSSTQNGRKPHRNSHQENELHLNTKNPTKRNEWILCLVQIQRKEIELKKWRKTPNRNPWYV